MRYLASPLIAASLLATFASAGRTPPQAETAAVVFFDDFAAPALDRTKWNVTVAGPVYNDEQQAYVDSPDTVTIARGADAAGASNGALVLQARYRPGTKTTEGKTQDFVSGRIDSSRATMSGAPFRWGMAMGRISSLNAPASVAAAAL